MEIRIFDHYVALSEKVADVIIAQIKNKPDCVICLASGDTPKLAYATVARKILRDNIDISECIFIGLDEWVGVPPDNEGSCAYFFKKYFLDTLQIAPDRFHLFNALSDDLQDECRKMDAIIYEKEGIDLMVVGIGLNGHIGFNEPGVSNDLYSHIIELDDKTQTVGQKYFKEAVALKQGITLGFNHLMESKKVLLIANGFKKADIIQKTIQEEISNKIPATIIREHPNSFLMIDREAATQILDS